MSVKRPEIQARIAGRGSDWLERANERMSTDEPYMLSKQAFFEKKKKNMHFWPVQRTRFGLYGRSSASRSAVGASPWVLPPHVRCSIGWR
jgi:hypothetical protein